MSTRSLLSADALFSLVRAEFEQVPDQRADNAKIDLADALMSGLAMFSLKDPSLLAFEARRATDHNLHTIFKIETVPCDTQLRTILDEVELDALWPECTQAFTANWRRVENWASLCFWRAATWCRWTAQVILARRRFTVRRASRR
jgi:hypothetical protein